MNLSSRRQFLKTAVKTTLVLLLFAPFRKLIAAAKKEDKPPTWKELIDYARWCPSVHNLQPHKIKIISDSEAGLYYDSARLLPVGDPKSIFATVAMGVFVENLSIAAASYNYGVEIAEFANPISVINTGNVLFATIKLVTSNKIVEDLTRDLILKRRTSRIKYNGKPLGESTLEQLKTEARPYENEFFHTSDKALIESIVELNQKTLFEDLESKADREELNKLFRYNKHDAETKKDGLWAKCMGFSGSLMKSVFQHHEKWSKGQRKKLLSNNYKSKFKGTSTLCWMGGKFTNTSEWFTAGRALARIWLRITKDGAYLQPFGSLITNVGAYEKINEKFTQPAEGKQIWMIFRAGHSKEPARSYRLNTEDIIIK